MQRRPKKQKDQNLQWPNTTSNEKLPFLKPHQTKEDMFDQYVSNVKQGSHRRNTQERIASSRSHPSFAKIIVFNILLQPQTLRLTLSPQQEKMHLHTKILSNIVYELIIDVPDKQRADQSITIGNWRGFTQFELKACESKSKRKVSKKNEFISGLLGHSYIRQTYSISNIQAQSTMIQQLVTKLQMLIKQYHCQVSKNCM